MVDSLITNSSFPLSKEDLIPLLIVSEIPRNIPLTDTQYIQHPLHSLSPH